MFALVWLFITYADDSRGSKALIRVCLCVCLSVCPLDWTKTAETTITKLATGIVRHESSYIHLILGQKVKVTGPLNKKK